MNEAPAVEYSWNPTRHEIWVRFQPTPLKLAPEIPEGKYHIKAHYRLGDEEFDAEWDCEYRSSTGIVRWAM